MGQEPKVNERITGWAVQYSTVPVLVKLTPNVSDILPHGMAAKRGGAPVTIEEAKAACGQ